MKSSEPLRVLIVDDDPNYAATLRVLLKKEFPAEVVVAGDCSSARKAFSPTSFDLVTLDYQLPDGDGLELLEEFTASEVHPPVIMVTGKGDEETAAKAVSLGSAGYVVKDMRIHMLFPEALRNALEKEEYKRALRDSEREYRELVELSKSIILKTDTGGNITFINKFGCEFFGYSEEELVGKNVIGTIVPEVESTGRDLTAMVRDIMSDPDAHHPNLNENVRRDGERYGFYGPIERSGTKAVILSGPLPSVTTSPSARRWRRKSRNNTQYLKASSRAPTARYTQSTRNTATRASTKPMQQL